MTDKTPSLLLFKHEDGRYGVAPEGQADFTNGDPKWHRIGPVEVVRMAQPQTDPWLIDVRVQGSTVYVLNDQRKPSNLWWASVQPGQDDNGSRVSDVECQTIAQKIAAALSAPAVETVAGKEAPDCEHCLGSGQVFGHADNCDDDLCALNGDAHSCAGKLEPCECSRPLSVAPKVEPVPVIYVDQRGALHSSVSKEQVEAILGPHIDHIRFHLATPQADSAQPRDLTAEENEVVQAAVRDSATLVAPGRLVDSAQPVGADTLTLRSLLEDWVNSFADSIEGGEGDELVAATRAALANRAIPAEQTAPTGPELTFRVARNLCKVFAESDMTAAECVEALDKMAEGLAAHPQGAVDRSAEAKDVERWKELADSEGSRAVKYLRIIRKVRAVVNEWPEVEMPDSPLSRIRTIVAAEPGKGEGK